MVNPRQDARNGAGRYEAVQEVADRAAEAARLKAANPGMTYQQIADAVGYHDKAGAWRAVQRCRESVIRQAGAELVAAEAAHLDDLFVAALEVMEKDHVVVSHGRVVYGDDGQPLIDPSPRLAALREMRMIRESFRKLYGTDQPTKTEISGGVKYEVVGVDPQELV
jgi:AraC-like DNA-binding protein